MSAFTATLDAPNLDVVRAYLAAMKGGHPEQFVFGGEKGDAAFAAYDTAKVAAEATALAQAKANGNGAPRAISAKVAGEKGTVCAYGVNSRRPVSLYASQWVRLLRAAPIILDAISRDAIAVKETETVDAVRADAQALRNVLAPVLATK